MNKILDCLLMFLSMILISVEHFRPSLSSFRGYSTILMHNQIKRECKLKHLDSVPMQNCFPCRKCIQSKPHLKPKDGITIIEIFQIDHTYKHWMTSLRVCIPLITSFNACYCNSQNALYAICQNIVIFILD